MRKILGLLMGAVAACMSLASSAAAEVKLLIADAMLDVKTKSLIAYPAILIDGKKVMAVGTQGILAIPAGVETIDLTGLTLLPGFIDMHTHLTSRHDLHGYRSLEFNNTDRAINGVVNARVTLMAGFTTVRDLGAGGYADLSVRDGINQGRIIGPRMFAAGISLGGTGGHCSDNNLLSSDAMALGRGVADGPWALRAMVRQNIKYGVDLIKICPTGGVLSKGTVPGIQQMTEEEIRAVVEEAHMRGLKVAAHAHGTEGIKAAIRGGVDSVEHVSFIDKEGIRLAKKFGTALSMDIYNTEYILGEGEAAGMLPESLDKERIVGGRQRQSFTDAVKAGALVVFGSDAGVYPHGDNPKQFSRMVKFGMSEMQALRAATILAAKTLGHGDTIGAIAPGYYADIVAVPGNPLADITVVEKVSFVMKEGKVYKDAR